MISLLYLFFDNVVFIAFFSMRLRSIGGVKECLQGCEESLFMSKKV